MSTVGEGQGAMCGLIPVGLEWCSKRHIFGLYSCTFGTASFARVVAIHNCYEFRYLIVYSCVNSMVAGNLQGNKHSLHTHKSLCKFKKDN